MPNVFFNLKITAATITDDIRISIYNELDLTTPLASLQQNAPHLDQQFSIPGIPPQNLIYKVLQVQTNGTTVIAQLGQASFVPTNDTLEIKESVDVIFGADNIPGTSTVWPTGVSHVNIPDFAGWELQDAGRPGQYPGKPYADYDYDSSNGDFDLLNGDQFQPDGDRYHFAFLPRIVQSSGGIGGGTVAGAGFQNIILVTANRTLVASEMGNKILIAPSANFITITLPSISTSAANQITYFEMVYSAPKCCKFALQSGDVLSWFDSEINICPGESFELYKRVVSTGVFEWRLQNERGNFFTVGEFVYDDESSPVNKVKGDGSGLDYLQYYRLYRKRGMSGISYTSWVNTNPSMYVQYSQKQTGSGTLFHVPLLSDMYMKNAGVATAGTFNANKLLNHNHLIAKSGGGDNEGALNNHSYMFYSKDNGQNNAYILSGGANVPDVGLTGNPCLVTLNTGTGVWEVNFIGSNKNEVDARVSNLYIRF